PIVVATASPTLAPSATPPPASATAVATPVPATMAKEQVAERVYVFPVKSAACQYSSSHHDYPAADIFCPIGTEFVAVTSGVVDFVSSEDLWNPAADNPADRGGLSVAIIGDDGVRYYGSHLSAIADGIAPGVHVVAEQLLGRTGRSGNARNTDPHVHFGISRPTTPDDWQTRRGQIWPQRYLAAWKQGRNMTPAFG
ncbi:MAG: M23 family metallopeptidase, partial [Roseiflexaceae bacterium]|nr:M23 family metallopeptidase [Roseiflexaceae bacterium]